MTTSSNLRFLLDALIQGQSGPLAQLQQLVSSDTARISSIEATLGTQDWSTYMQRAAGLPAGNYANLGWKGGHCFLQGAPSTPTFFGLGNSAGTELGYLTSDSAGQALTLRNTTAAGSVALATPGGAITVDGAGNLLFSRGVCGGSVMRGINDPTYGEVLQLEHIDGSSGNGLAINSATGRMVLSCTPSQLVSLPLGVSNNGVTCLHSDGALVLDAPYLIFGGTDIVSRLVAVEKASPSNTSLHTATDVNLNAWVDSTTFSYPTVNGATVCINIFFTQDLWNKLFDAGFSWIFTDIKYHQGGQPFSGVTTQYEGQFSWIAGDGTTPTQRYLRVGWSNNHINWTAGASALNIMGRLIISAADSSGSASLSAFPT